MTWTNFGLIEIVLGFGAILALAVYEAVRNRRALAKLRAEQANPPQTRTRT